MPEDFAHRRRRGDDCSGDFTMAAPAFVVQAQYFQNLAHG
jgi:hypothetical protein